MARPWASTRGCCSREIGGRHAQWDEALDLVATSFSETIARHGPDSVGFYVSGQLLTEDYYVANKLMKGFIGSANIDTNSRLCMASSVAGHRRAFGEDIVPGIYEDLELADLVVLVGSNTAWCHPILYQRLLAARIKRGTRIVVIDPRGTATTDECDLHLARRSWHGCAAVQRAAGASGEQLGARHRLHRGKYFGFREHECGRRGRCADAGARRRRAAGWRPPTSGDSSNWFAATERTVTVYSQGVNQSAHGTDKVNAIINCHLATGRIGRPGMGPFSVTGQPNAMGGREVGGLANQLAAHMDFDDRAAVDRVARFWQAPNMATRGGLKAVDLFEAAGDGRVKALWIMGTNPAVSMPDAGAGARRAQGVRLRRRHRRDRHRHDPLRDVVLPAAAWGEKDGTVTNSERAISRQRPFLPPPGEARADWRIICDVAQRMGFAQRLRLCLARRDLSRARGAVRLRERRRPAVRHRWLGRHRRRRLSRSCAPALAGSEGRGQRRRQAARRRPLPDPGRARALRAGAAGGAGAVAGRRLPDRAQHRPPARPVAHDDPHRPRAPSDGECA